MRKGALDEAVYRKEPIRRHVSKWTEFLYSMQTPLLAFVFVQRIFVYGRFRSPHPAPHPRYANGLRELEDKAVEETVRESTPATEIPAVFESGDFAAVVSKGSAAFYSLWYFVRENGAWKCAGEDIGGDSEAGAETTFRDKAPAVATATGLIRSDGGFRCAPSGPGN